MKDNNISNEDYKKPLIEIDNEIIEMTKNAKIINTLKEDIDQLITNNSSLNNDGDISLIKEKYNKIKNQIQKFMNKKKFIYNFIDNEKLNKKKPESQTKQILKEVHKEFPSIPINTISNCFYENNHDVDKVRELLRKRIKNEITQDHIMKIAQK